MPILFTLIGRHRRSDMRGGGIDDPLGSVLSPYTRIITSRGMWVNFCLIQSYIPAKATITQTTSIVFWPKWEEGNHAAGRERVTSGLTMLIGMSTIKPCHPRSATIPLPQIFSVPRQSLYMSARVVCCDVRLPVQYTSQDRTQRFGNAFRRYPSFSHKKHGLHAWFMIMCKVPPRRLH